MDKLKVTMINSLFIEDRNTIFPETVGIINLNLNIKILLIVFFPAGTQALPRGNPQI
jgi:hypothetical protein